MSLLHRPQLMRPERRGNGKWAIVDRLIEQYFSLGPAPCSMAVYENKLGGRICVSGYYPWDHLHSLSKTAQMKAVMRWLSRERLPAYVASYHKVNLWVREPQDGRIALALLNANLDVADGLELALPTPVDQVRVFDMRGKEHLVRAGSADGPYRRFVLPAVEAWSMLLVVLDKP